MVPDPSLLKRKRSRPSEYWIASPAAPASIPPELENRAPKVTKPSKRVAEAPKTERPKRRRSGPSEWWKASSSRLQEQQESEAEDVGTESIPRGRRLTRVSDVAIEQPDLAPSEKQGKSKRNRSGEVVRVETATSTLRKARGRPPKAIVNQVEPSKPKKHGTQSSSAPAERHASTTTKSKAHKSKHTSTSASVSEPPRQKRKPVERAHVEERSSTKRRRLSVVQEQEEEVAQREEEHPEYQHLAASIRKVHPHTIATKWKPLPTKGIDHVLKFMQDAQRPVVVRLKEERKRTQASTALQGVTRRLVKKIARGLPFPPGTRAQTEDDFDFEKVLDHNRNLEAQLTPILHANELLEDELRKEKILLESEKSSMEELDTNAKSAATLRKQGQRKLHSLLQTEDTMAIDEELVLKQHDSAQLSNLLKEEDVQDIVHRLQDHVDSMQGNLKQIDGVGETIAKSKAAVQATLYDHLDTAKYEGVVLGLD